MEKRELQLKKEETKKKMAKLLEGVVQGKLAANGLLNVKRTDKTEDAQDQPVSKSQRASHKIIGCCLI